MNKDKNNIGHIGIPEVEANKRKGKTNGGRTSGGSDKKLRTFPTLQIEAAPQLQEPVTVSNQMNSNRISKYNQSGKK